MRIHIIQHWLNLADLAREEATYDNASLRRFVGINAGCEAVPDATTLLNDGRAWALSPRAWSAGPALARRRHPALLLPIGRPRKPLTRAALQQIVKGIFRGAAHWLRQSAGSHMADQQVDRRLVHDNLGHASLTITAQCLHVDDDRRHRETG